jgi:hypothetical protein
MVKDIGIFVIVILLYILTASQLRSSKSINELKKDNTSMSYQIDKLKNILYSKDCTILVQENQIFTLKQQYNIPDSVDLGITCAKN